MMVKTIIKRSLSLLMVAVMLITFIPNLAWAADLNTGITGLSASYDSGTWNRSGTTITGSVTTSSSSGCSGGTNYTTAEGTLTLKNTSGSKATLSFTAEPTLNGGTVNINGAAAANRNYSFVLNANETVTVYIKSCETEEKTTTVKLSNLQLISEKNVTITFVPSENGSYSVDGTTVTSSRTITKKSTDSFALAATPASGYRFAGWIVNNDPSSVISSETPASISFNENQTVTAYFVDDTIAVFDVSGKQFYNLNSAVSYAQSNSKTKISLATDGVLPAGSYTIPKGITLLIPFDAAYTVYTTAPSVVYGSHVMPTAFRTLTMATGANITVQSGGAICCSGKLSSSGQMGGWNGTPTGPDGRINMLGGSKITLESGANLYCWGYIYGAGSVEAKSGSTVYEAFQIKDWRGGTATSNVYKYAFIFNQYYIQNIEVPLTIRAGASEKLYSSVNASSSAYPMSASFIGSGGMFTISSGYIVKDYQEQTDRLIIEVNGIVSVSPMTLSGLPMIGSISTENYILPITSNISIDLKSGSSQVTQDLELLPGVEINVGSGAEFKINSGKKVYLYDNSDWGNFSGSTRMYPIGYSVANGTTAVRSIASLKDAVLDVNGTVTVAGSLFTSNGGGHITSSEGTQGENGKIVFSTAPAASSTIYEMEGNSTKTAVSFTAPKLHNGDDSYSATVGTGASTWYYDKDGEHWYRYLVSFVYNGKTVGAGYYCENNDTVTYDASWLTGLGASVTSGSATASVSGTNVNVTNVTANSVVTLTGTSANFVPTFVLNEKQYQNYRLFTGNTINETREINGDTYYVVKKAAAAMAVGAEFAAPTDQEMGVSADNHNAIVWNLSGQSANSGNPYNGFVPVGENAGGPAYIFGFYTGAVAYNSFTDQYYATLAEAMADVPQYGTGTVRLIADCGSFEEENSTAAYPNSEATNLTIDLNGHRAVGRLINKGTMILELNGGTWDYHTGATAAAAAYQAAAAVTNSGTLTIQDSTGGGRILADAISNAGVPNHAAVIRNFSGGTMSVSNVTLENTQNVNGYTSVIMNDRSTITSLQNVTILSPRGYAIWNHGGHIGTIHSCTVNTAYGIYNRNVRGSNAIGSGYNIANYGTIDLIQDSTVTAGQYALNNSAVITELNNCTFTAHPDSAQVNTVGTTAASVQGNVPCYTVYNSNAWWYDTAVWKRVDSGLTRTDDYKEDESCRPTIDTITDCRIYAENTSTSADHGYALYNLGVINSISGTTEIKTYKHPDNAKSIASNYAMRNSTGGIIKSISGTVEIRASGCCAVYNDGQFTARTVNSYGDKIGGVQLHATNTYGQPSAINSINAGGSITAGSYYAIYTNGYIGSIGGGLTISANNNVLLNSGAGSLSSYDYVRTYTSNTDAATETKRVETYVRNLENGGVIGSINGVSFVGTGSNSYYLLQNQGYIGTLANVNMSAASPRAGEGYAMVLNGDGRQAGYTLTREPYAYESLYITPYEYHYDYDVPTIDVIDNVTIAKNATFAFRNLGRINTLKNSTVTGTQYVLVNAASGPYITRDSIRYYSGATKFANTKNNGSELTYCYERAAAEIATIDNCTITGTSTYTLYNGGHIGTLTNNTISSTNTTVLFNGGASLRSYDYNLLDIITVTATDSACTVTYGANNETRVITTDYDAPAIDLIGEGNKISGTYQVLVNLGTITAIDGGSSPVEITATTQKQIGGIYNYTGTLDQRVATTPYTAGTAGTATNQDTYLNAHIGSIKNTIITANGIGIQNGSANTTYLPVIDELGEGLEIHANCTTAGYHAVYNTTFAKIGEISGGIYTAAKATTNAYKNNNTNPEHATLISGGDFKGAASTRANAVFEPDNTNRQTYPEGVGLVGTRSVTFHDGTTADDYHFIGTVYTVTWRLDDSDAEPLEVDTVPGGETPSYQGETPTKADDDTYAYTFAGWATTPNQETGVPASELPPVTADVTYYAAFSKQEKGFTVTWRVDDSAAPLEVDEHVNGKPSYDGTAPTKAADADYVYTFVGWATAPGQETGTAADDLPAVTADITYYAAFGKTAQTYTYDPDGWIWTGSDETGYTAAKASFKAGVGDFKKEVTANVSSNTTAATCAEAGKTVYTATVSFNGQTYTDTKEVTIPALGHAWCEPVWNWTGIESATATFTCGNDAGHVETLEATISKTETAATCEADGSVTYTATVTFNSETYTDTKTETITALGHDWNAPSYEWASDNSTVTATRVCRHDASHIETETVNTTSAVTKAATCTEKGETTYTATFTNAAFEPQSKTVANIDALGHKPGDRVIENRTEATCETAGSYDEVIYCTVCGEELSRETKSIPALGHAWCEPVWNWTGIESATATFTCGNDAGHVETLEATISKTETAATCEADGSVTYTATVSFNSETYTDTKTETITALGHDWNAPSYEWASDNSTVTATRVCRHDASHVETETVNTTSAVTKAATCTEKGETTYTATFTNAAFEPQSKTVANIDALGHAWGEPVWNWTGVESATATFTCGNDAGHVETLEATISKTETAATCEADGSVTYTATVTFNSETYTDTKTETIPALGHDWNAPSYEWASDNSTVTATRVCRHDASHVETESANTTVVTTAATCETPEKTTYTAAFTNAAFEMQTKTVDTAPALGHAWGEISYSWAEDNSEVTATRICGNDPSHVETETVKTTVEVTKKATCEGKGEKTYTASFTNPAFTTQTKAVETDALGHDWGEIDYRWADDNSSVTATRICGNNESHIETETVQTNAVTTEASCTEPGVTTYTAVFENEAFEAQQKVVTNQEALGHAWGEVSYSWAEDNSEVTATRICANDPSHIESETVSTSYADATPASCEADGLRVYTAAFENPAFEPQTREVTIPATGHAWSEPVWSWDGTASATASFVCGNDESHTVALDAAISEEEIPADCEVDGKTIYTAAVTLDGTEYTNSKEVRIPATGHRYSEPEYMWILEEDGSSYTVTATVTCQKNSDHDVSETVAATYEVISEPTETENGLGRYTAVFQSEFFTTQFKDVVLPKFGPDGYHIYVTDYTKGKANISLDAEALYEGEVSFTVNCDKVCKVGLVNDDGTITKLVCTTTDETHSFTVTVTDADVNLVVVINGDFNLDGSMKKTDATLIKKLLVELIELDESTAAVQTFAGDVNDDGRLKQADATVISKVLVELVSLSW